MSLLGEGMLNWHRHDRISDRYGAVALFGDRNHEPSLDDYVGDAYPKSIDYENPPSGLRGRLIAEVVRTRQSGHIGDLFRGLRPPLSEEERPRVGSRHELGVGTVFIERKDGSMYLGVRPDDGRDIDWLDPKALYLLHEQTVRLYFEAEDEG